MKIYTKTGDDGSTGLQGGTRVPKSHPRIIAYGVIDEVNSSIGIVLSEDLDNDLKNLLSKIQNDLFLVGSDLSNPDLKNDENRVSDQMIDFLENQIDIFEEKLSPITNFILPGGHKTASLIHSVRTITRRAETQIVDLAKKEKINENCLKYLNRLSDLLFVIARTVNMRNQIEDIIWKP